MIFKICRPSYGITLPTQDIDLARGEVTDLNTVVLNRGWFSVGTCLGRDTQSSMDFSGMWLENQKRGKIFCSYTLGLEYMLRMTFSGRGYRLGRNPQSSEVADSVGTNEGRGYRLSMYSPQGIISDSEWTQSTENNSEVTDSAIYLNGR